MIYILTLNHTYDQYLQASATGKMIGIIASHTNHNPGSGLRGVSNIVYHHQIAQSQPTAKAPAFKAHQVIKKHEKWHLRDADTYCKENYIYEFYDENRDDEENKSDEVYTAKWTSVEMETGSEEDDDDEST